MSGWMYALASAAIPLAVTAIVALLLGIWIGRGLRAGADTAAAAVDRSPASDRPAASDSAAIDAATAGDDEAPTADLPVTHGSPVAPLAALPSTPPENPDERDIGGPDPDLAEQLTAAEERIAVLVGRLDAETKRHQIEFGRLESGALAALDGAIAKGNGRAIELGDALDDMRKRARLMQSQLDYMNRRSEQLERSLAERDARLAEVTAELDNSRRTER